MVNTIVVKGQPIAKEAKANAAITPGHLVELRSDGELQVHGTAAGTAAKAFARENEVFGTGIDTAYAAEDNVLYSVFRPGDEINALVAAGAPAIVINDKLESAGDGTLRKVVTSAATADTARSSVVAIATEAVDNSGGGAAVRIIVEAL